MTSKNPARDGERAARADARTRTPERPPLTPIQEADIVVAVQQNELRRGGSHIEAKAKEILVRLERARDEVNRYLDRAMTAQAEGEAAGADQNAIDEEYVKRIGTLAYHMVDDVLTQVGNMNLGGLTRDAIDCERARAALVAARAARRALSGPDAEHE